MVERYRNFNIILILSIYKKWKKFKIIIENIFQIYMISKMVVSNSSIFSNNYNNINDDYNNSNTKRNKQLELLPTKHNDRKSITFNELCPIWSKKLSLGLDRVDKFMIESDSKYCIVGEAWQFSGRYTGYYLAPLIPFVGCWTCIKYTRKFADTSKKTIKKANLTRSDFQPLIESFMRHWNEKHLKKK